MRFVHLIELAVERAGIESDRAASIPFQLPANPVFLVSDSNF